MTQTAKAIQNRPVELGTSARVLLGGAGVVGFALATALGARLPGIPVPPLDVPITLQTLAVGLCGLTLGARLGMLSMALYLLLGLLGAPVFADGGSGVSYAFGLTGGYLLGFIAAQPVIAVLGRMASEQGRWARHAGVFGAVVAGHAVIFLLGVTWAKLVRDLSPGLEPATWAVAWTGGCLIFLPGMVLKSGIAGVCGPMLARLRHAMGW